MSTGEQRLRDALKKAPYAPEAPGFGARVAARARRRRTIRHVGVATGTGALCVAIVAGAFALRPEGETEQPVATPTASPTRPPVEPPVSERLDCRRPPLDDVVGDPVVPTGAVAARLCGGLVDNGGFNLVWPADRLEDVYVDRLVKNLNGLEPYVQPEACTLPLSPPFDIVLLYPDGSKVWAHGDPSGTCEYVAVQGGEAWAGAPALLDRALGIIEDRRADVGPGATIEQPRCPVEWQDVSSTAGAAAVSPDSRVAVTACRYTLERGDPATITQSWDGLLEKQATVEDAETVVRLVADGSRSDPCGGAAYDLEPTQDVLLVRDSFGDVQVVSTAPCWSNLLTGVRRYPSAALANEVADILD
jgi:hypothetical protein